MTPDEIWFRDLTVLWRRPLEFFPSRDQTDAERTNAITRFVMYAAAAVSFAGYADPMRAAAAALAVIMLVAVTYNASPRQQQARGKETFAGAQPRVCTRPTPENPFMNVLATEYGTLRPPACDYDDVKDDVAAYFERGLHREITDVYKKKASDRQFITMPVTETVPDTGAFRNFLYGAVQRCPARLARGIGRVAPAVESMVDC